MQAEICEALTFDDVDLALERIGVIFPEDVCSLLDFFWALVGVSAEKRIDQQSVRFH